MARRRCGIDARLGGLRRGQNGQFAATINLRQGIGGRGLHIPPCGRFGLALWRGGGGSVACVQGRIGLRLRHCTGLRAGTIGFGGGHLGAQFGRVILLRDLAAIRGGLRFALRHGRIHDDLSRLNEDVGQNDNAAPHNEAPNQT